MVAERKQATPLTTLLRKEPPPEGKPRRKARLHIFAEENFVSKILCRQGEAAKRLTIFAEKNEGSEFFSGKGKPMK